MDKTINGNVSDIFRKVSLFRYRWNWKRKIEKTEVIKNESANQMSGSGISAAKFLAENVTL